MLLTPHHTQQELQSRKAIEDDMLDALEKKADKGETDE